MKKTQHSGQFSFQDIIIQITLKYEGKCTNNQCLGLIQTKAIQKEGKEGKGGKEEDRGLG